MPAVLKKSLALSPIGLVFAAVALAPVLAQDGLPPGPGMAETMKGCGGCHGISQILAEKRSAEEWSTTVLTMVNFGAPVSEDEFPKVVTYLATYFGTSPPPAAVPAETAAPPTPVSQ